jgi:hypothetical protein
LQELIDLLVELGEACLADASVVVSLPGYRHSYSRVGEGESGMGVVQSGVSGVIFIVGDLEGLRDRYQSALDLANFCLELFELLEIICGQLFWCLSFGLC